MYSRGKVSHHMLEFSKFLHVFGSYERMLEGNGRVTIHCKTDTDFQVVQHLTKEPDVYALQVGDSFSIFLKGWDKQ